MESRKSEIMLLAESMTGHSQRSCLEEIYFAVSLSDRRETEISWDFSKKSLIPSTITLLSESIKSLEIWPLDKITGGSESQSENSQDYSHSNATAW